MNMLGPKPHLFFTGKIFLNTITENLIFFGSTEVAPLNSSPKAEAEDQLCCLSTVFSYFRKHSMFQVFFFLFFFKGLNLQRLNRPGRGTA